MSRGKHVMLAIFLGIVAFIVFLVVRKENTIVSPIPEEKGIKIIPLNE